MNFPTKASSYLKITGSPDHVDETFLVTENGSVSIYASNFYNLEQGDPSIIFSSSDSGYLNNGYMAPYHLSVLNDTNWKHQIEIPFEEGAFGIVLWSSLFLPNQDTL